MPIEVVESLSVEVLRRPLDVALGGHGLGVIVAGWVDGWTQ